MPIQDSRFKIQYSRIKTGVGYVIRHGATRLNRDGLTRGASDVPLSAAGKRQAEEAAALLKDKGVTSIRKSGILRSAQMAKIIGQAVGVRPVTAGGLDTMDIGELTMQPEAVAEPEIARLTVDAQDEAAPGGECYRDFLTRAWPELRKFLLDVKAGKTPAIVTHGRVSNLLLAYVDPDAGAKLSRKILRQQPAQQPGEVWQAAWDGKKFTFEPLPG